MANSAQARKRVRQSERRNLSNTVMNSKMRTALKGFRAAVEKKDKDSATQLFTKLIKHFGRMISRNLMHKNKVARLTSQMNKQVKDLG